MKKIVLVPFTSHIPCANLPISKPGMWPAQTVPDNDASEAMPDIDAVYVSDDEEEEQPSNNHRSRRSKRVMAQHRENNMDGLHRIA